eukprot:6405171-Amphidinium_carterae.1
MAMEKEKGGKDKGKGRKPSKDMQPKWAEAKKGSKDADAGKGKDTNVCFHCNKKEVGRPSKQN